MTPISPLPQIQASELAQTPLILIAEDSRTQAAMLSQLMQQSGYRSFITSNGREAMELAREHAPDLVISDVLMPDMDGFEMCRALKDNSQTSGVPVLLLTALSDPADIMRGLQAGADYYVTKPYDVDYLTETVQSILRSAPTENSASGALQVEVAGQNYLVDAGRRQMLNLLLSTYSNAVLQNRQLLSTQHDLRTLNAQLVAQRQQIVAQGRELREMNAQLRTQADYDGLTGLHNHRVFKERLSEEVARSKRHDTPLSLLLIDVDRFKNFNDAHGHPAGDEVLRCVSRIMAEQARQIDFVARYGGEEFAILLPNTARQMARLVAERVRAAIECGPWQLRPITASVGIAGMNASSDANSLLAWADTALYHSKTSGRNRVTDALDLDLEGIDSSS